MLAGVYREKFGRDVQIRAIHAGLECGMFSDKIEGLDCVSFGPDVLDVHSPRERMSISSVARVWDFLLTVLERLAGK